MAITNIYYLGKDGQSHAPVLSGEAAGDRIPRDQSPNSEGPRSPVRRVRGYRSRRYVLPAAFLVLVAVLITVQAMRKPGSPAHHGPAPGPSLAATLADPGYMPHAVSVAFSRKGPFLAVANRDAHAYIWNTATRRIVHTFSNPAGKWMVSVAFSPNGAFAAAGDASGSAFLWDTATYRSVKVITVPGGKGAPSIAFSPDSRLLAVGEINDSDGHYGVTYLLNIKTGRTIELMNLNPGGFGAGAVAFSPDGRILAVGDINERTYLWHIDAISGDITPLRAPLDSPASRHVRSVAFSADGKTLAVSHDNGTIYLWNTTTWTATPITNTGSSPVTSVAFSPNGPILATGADDGNVYLWNTVTFKPIRVLRNPDSGGIDSLAFSPDGRVLAAGGGTGRIHLWKLPPPGT